MTRAASAVPPAAVDGPASAARDARVSRASRVSRTALRATQAVVGTTALALVLVAPAAAAPLGLAPGAAPAATDGDEAVATRDVTVVNTETVQARLSPTGELRSARLYEQLSFTGSGRVTVANPTSVQGLRNLDGFGGFSVASGVMTTTVDVDGERRLRTLSDFDGELPIGVEVSYTLDGEPVEPTDVVGRSGLLEAHYVVRNLTVRQDEVEYDDGTGTMATTTAETVIPMVGQLVTVLPSSFTAVTSGEASMAGDGRGGTKLSFTMTLFPPIGSTSAEFGWSAQVRDAALPPATITAVPVSPLESPSFRGGAASYANGAESGAALTAGATEIDGHLLELRDGAAELLDGLQQLYAGAQELAAGLTDEAAPGADELADGAGQLDDGAHRLAAGAAQLTGGLRSADAAAPTLVDGLTQVRTGLGTVDAGLAQMSAAVGNLPTSAQPLKAGVGQLDAGIAQLLAGVQQLQATAQNEGQVLLAVAATNPTVTVADAPGVARMQALGQFVAGVAAQKTDPVAKAQLEGLAAMYAGAAVGATLPLGPGLQVLGQVLTDGVVPGLVRLQCGLDATTTGAATCGGTPGLNEGLAQLGGGIDQLVGGVVAQIQGGIGSEGQTAADGTLRGGVGSLSDGMDRLVAGAKTLVDGIDRLTAGAGTLTAGTGELAAGTTELAAGAGELAAGLDDAAAGSQQIAAGLGTASSGAPALVDGAQQLSDEGTSVLVETGASTAADYGVKYAVLEAGAARTAAEGMAYGGPEGSTAVTAYSLEIAGVDGSSSRAVSRGVAAAGLFAVAAGLATFLRRRGLA